LHCGPNRFVVSVTGASLEPPDVLELSTTRITFDSVIANCQTDDKEFSITNLVCAGLTIDSVTITGEGWSIGSVQSITALGSATLPIHFAPLTPGFRVGTVQIFHHLMEEPGRVKVVTLVGTAREPVVCPISVESSTTLATVVAGFVELPLTIATTQLLPTGPVSVSALLTYNTDLIQLKQVNDLAPSVTLNSVRETSQGLELSMMLDPQLFQSQTTTLGTIHFEAFLTTERTTPITITTLNAESETGCYRFEKEGGAVFELILECGDETISKMMGSATFSIKSLYPNPANNELNVELAGTVPSDVRYELQSVLGERVQQGALPETKTIALDGLPQGFYILSVRGANNETSRSFRIER
jgi:hypothetical protein